ncbi:MAG: chitobiase/beta-hexosaminidase C-terminal domain-containing protein [Candidatus Cloacimonetes bacterium]|jgi:flagellar hook assembly protein FlgD|nr:chitobiase/beta-hexosaminidase C-terminal domain-containing protein [Candidatus Cloacimonadota bacterium]MDD3097801.1 chitobiase/beta-hexosaminidase C-terminal domain-containing protein [Candidatus Cloacimonadota bacterium]MDY0337874.1 chitobiase/beta-hexosaminidase C-terminal domain-containing protein [Candidatus Cloacimonadaceae bacterium]
MMKKTLATLILVAAMSMIFAQAADLFFSEYIEGSSNNKAIEIFNGTGATVDLSQYAVKLGSNGGEWSATNSITLEGSLPDNTVFVIANSSAAAEILNVADMTSTVTYFNGDDALGLFHGENMIDIIGVYMEDPGTAWDVAGVGGATLNHTLIRKPHIVQGNTTWASSAGTNMDDSEWLVEAQDYFANIGMHTFNPGGGDMAGTPTFDPPAGAYTSPINVSMSSSTAGASIRYTLDGSEPTTSSQLYSTPIAINSNTTIKAKAWADDYEPSYVATAVYIFPIVVQDLVELRQQSADNSTVYHLPNNVVLTFKQSNRNQKFVQDGQAAILIDDQPGVITTNYQIGDAIAGLTGKLTMYYETLQFIPTLDPGAPVSSGNDVYIPTVTIAQLNGDVGVNTYQSRLVHINDVHFDSPSGNYATNPAVNYAISDATGAMTFRTSFYDVDYIGTPMHQGDISMRGIIAHFQSGAQITPRMLADFNPTSNNDPVVSPAGITLIGNYPNPFNPSTTIQFSMDKAAPATVSIYNQKGQMVKSYDLPTAEKGINNLHWDGTDNSGNAVSSGVYHFRLKSGSYSSTKKMILMK